MHPIQQRREAIGWTLDQLAKQVGVTRGTVWQWEKGRIPRRQSLTTLAGVFGLDWLDLLNDIMSWRTAYQAA